MRRTNLCEHGVIELLNTIIFRATVLDLQKGLTESMLSGAEKEREIILLTWKNSWKVALEIRGFWPENEGKNEATVLDFFLQRGLTESISSGAEKNGEILPLT